jgi:DNA-3-methyladenine glycosylase I
MVLPALDGKTRCRWAATDPVLASYHDLEWGEPPVGDAGWFERLSLEVFQAGLSWRTVLAKRDGFRRAFHDFEPKIVAAFTAKDVTGVLRDPADPGRRARLLRPVGAGPARRPGGPTAHLPADVPVRRAAGGRGVPAERRPHPAAARAGLLAAGLTAGPPGRRRGQSGT